ncbi:MAG: sulfatase/phosphatase domain-containing protein, partial [Bacteroidota bacterium]
YNGGFSAFLNDVPAEQPFCFWFGASDPHRKYEPGSGAAAGIDPDAIALPGFYPESDTIRNDIADYYFEVQRFDSEVGAAISLLDSLGMLDNTIIVVTGDHGMPFPRCKGNLYDMGARVPLAMRWGSKLKQGSRIADFVSLTDLAPTFLDLAGVAVPPEMTGQSLAPLLLSDKSRNNLQPRDHIVFGRERHTPAQRAPSIDGYPCRAIRTDDYLYIRNFFPDRWPAGVPAGASHPMGFFADCDNGPTKTFLMERAQTPEVAAYYDLCFAQRPAEELYDVRKDPFQITNLARQQHLLAVKDSLAQKLNSVLRSTEDPRVLGGTVNFDAYPYRSSYELNKD